MNQTAVNDIFNYVCNIFPKQSIIREDMHDPEQTDIRITNGNRTVSYAGLVFDEQITLQIGEGGNDDYIFEYSNYDETNLIDIKNYLTAIANNAIDVKRKKFLGITISKKIFINS